jgi:hypothetical protein
MDVLVSLGFAAVMGAVVYLLGGMLVRRPG